MNLPIPTPTVEQAQASAALENSRQQYSLQSRAKLLIFHQPDVVQAARVGDPLLVDPKPTLAPMVSRQLVDDYKESMNPGSTRTEGTPVPTAVGGDASAAAATPATPAAPLALSEIPAADAPANSSDTGVNTAVPAASAPAGSGNGASVGAEILTPGVRTNADPNGGLKPVGGESAAPLPPIEKAGAAPDQVNDIAPGTKQAPAQTAPANGKKAKPGFDKGDESSSKHKKKKGLDKLNPF